MNQASTAKKLWSLFTPQQRYKALVLLVLMFIGMLLETLGVGLVIPILAIITSDDLINNYPALSGWFELLGNPSQAELIIFAMLTFVFVYLVKVIFLGFFNWWQAGFIADLQLSFSQQLFSDYLKRPYAFHLQYNSARLIHNVTTEVSMFVKSAQSSLVIISEALVFLGVSVLLISIEPKGALFVIIILGVTGWIIFRATKGHILQWGKARQLHEGFRLQHLQQGLGSVKDIKLLGREGEFIDQFGVHNSAAARVGRLWTTMQALPRLCLELLVVLSLTILVVAMVNRSDGIELLVPTLGAFAAAAFRIMPSISRVLQAFQSLRFAIPAVNKLYEEFNFEKESSELKDQKENFSDDLILDKKLNLKNITFQYANSHKVTLSDINLSIKKGSTIGFIGSTGAGKSTLVDVILGLLTPTSGEIQIDNVNVQRNLRGWQDQIGYVPQSIYITDDSIRRNIAFGLADEHIDDELVWKALEAAHLDVFVQEMPETINTVLGEHGVLLSGGQRQRIGIARALYHGPDVLVLDEATSSLDVETESDVMQTVKDLHGEKTILIVAHRLSTIENCDWIYRLEKGGVVQQGHPDDVLYKDVSSA